MTIKLNREKTHVTSTYSVNFQSTIEYWNKFFDQLVNWNLHCGFIKKLTFITFLNVQDNHVYCCK